MNPAEYVAHLSRGEAELRKFAEARMKSTCTIRRKTGTKTKLNGLNVPEWVVVATVPCRVSSGRDAGRSRTITVGDEETDKSVRTVSVPVGTDVRDADYLEVSGGRVYRVVESDGSDQTTALRLPVVAEQRPKEWQ